jgi:hypothetical protein
MLHPISKGRNRSPLAPECAIGGAEVRDHGHTQAGGEQSRLANLQTSEFRLTIMVKNSLTVAAHRAQFARIHSVIGKKLRRCLGKHLSQARVPERELGQLPLQSTCDSCLDLLRQAEHAAGKHFDLAA